MGEIAYAISNVPYAMSNDDVMNNGNKTNNDMLQYE